MTATHSAASIVLTMLAARLPADGRKSDSALTTPGLESPLRLR